MTATMMFQISSFLPFFLLLYYLSFFISPSHSSLLVDKGLLLLILGLGLGRYCELCCAVLVL